MILHFAQHFYFTGGTPRADRTKYIIRHDGGAKPILKKLHQITHRQVDPTSRRDTLSVTQPTCLLPYSYLATFVHHGAMNGAHPAVKSQPPTYAASRQLPLGGKCVNSHSLKSTPLLRSGGDVAHAATVAGKKKTPASHGVDKVPTSRLPF